MIFKKILCIFIMVALIMTLAFPTLATSTTELSTVKIATSTSSEYEAILSMSAHQRNSLAKESNSSVSSIEQLILERAKLSVNELKSKGYTDEQIAILKEYNGSPIEENPQLRVALATLDGSLSRVDYDTTSSAAKFSWEWSNEPILTGTAISDIVACAWRGTDNSNQECTMTFDSSNSECVIAYNNGALIYAEEYDIDEIDSQRNVEVEFPMTGPRFQAGWAEAGHLIIAIEEESPVHNLYSSMFIFGYGHMVFTISPTINVSGSGAALGLTFGTGTSEEFYGSIIIRTNGTTQVS